MKAQLTYNLPDEKQDFTLASKAWEWADTLWQVDQKLRNYLKHGHDFKTTDEALEDIRNHIYELMTEHGISFNDI